MIPFKQFKSDTSGIIRVFEEQTDQEELCWHKDHKNRKIKILEAGSGWKVQFDNKLPKAIHDGDMVLVKAGEWHRVLKGDGMLVIQIFED